METYQIRCRGHLDQRWEARFEGFEIKHELTPDEQPITIMTGPVIDQAALYSIINRLRDLGIELISLQVEKSESDQ